MRQLRTSRGGLASRSTTADEAEPRNRRSPEIGSDVQLSRSPERSTVQSNPERKSGPVQKPLSPMNRQPKQLEASLSKTKNTIAKAKGVQGTKPSGRPIYSFFNATTQRQSSSQNSDSPKKPNTVGKQPEIIDDDSEIDLNDDVKPSSGSSTALAMRKRKAQNGCFSDEVKLAPSASQKFRKASDGERVPASLVTNEDKLPWIDRFAPRDLSELAVHKRKVADVRQWLKTTLHGHRQRVLVLKGAAGVGKTTTIRLLAKELGVEIVEWKNPDVLASEGGAMGAAHFDDFVTRAGRTSGLQFEIPLHSKSTPPAGSPVAEIQSQTPVLLLIEEFPNTFTRPSVTLQSFRSSLLQHLSTAPPAQMVPTLVVLVVSETLLSTNTASADSFTAHRLLGSELISHPHLDIIEFNAIAPTFLTKALELIAVKEARISGRRKTPGPQVLRHLANSGDIRSAVSSLEFLCLKGDEGDAWSSKVNFSKLKKAKTEVSMTRSEEEALKLISNRESTLDIFHAVGKVVYNKRQDPMDASELAQPPSYFPQHRRTKIPESDIDDLRQEIGTDTATFISALHENYALSCFGSTAQDSLDSAYGCINSVSEADMLTVDRFSFGNRAIGGSAIDNRRHDEMAFELAVRGILFDLPFPVHRREPPGGKKGDAFRMFYPSSLKLWKTREEIEDTIDLLITKVCTDKLSGSRAPSEAGAHHSGVAHWNRMIAVERPKFVGIDREEDVTIPRGIKVEMLLERLPYLTQILSNRAPQTASLAELRLVTRIQGTSLPRSDDDNVEDEGGEDVNTLDHWATDLPEKDVLRSEQPSGGVRTNGPADEKGSAITGLLPSSLDMLILEDDDIVDD